MTKQHCNIQDIMDRVGLLRAGNRNTVMDFRRNFSRAMHYGYISPLDVEWRQDIFNVEGMVFTRASAGKIIHGIEKFRLTTRDTHIDDVENKVVEFDGCTQYEDTELWSMLKCAWNHISFFSSENRCDLSRFQNTRYGEYVDAYLLYARYIQKYIKWNWIYQEAWANADYRIQNIEEDKKFSHEQIVQSELSKKGIPNEDRSEFICWYNGYIRTQRLFWENFWEKPDPKPVPLVLDELEPEQWKPGVPEDGKIDERKDEREPERKDEMKDAKKEMDQEMGHKTIKPHCPNCPDDLTDYLLYLGNDSGWLTFTPEGHLYEIGEGFTYILKKRWFGRSAISNWYYRNKTRYLKVWSKQRLDSLTECYFGGKRIHFIKRWFFYEAAI